MNVGRIISPVTIQNASDLSLAVQCDALVDTGASLMVLPKAWKDRLGKLEFSAEIEVETATQDRVTAEVWGPVRIQIEGFRAIFNEVAFIEMRPERGQFEPLIGYIVLEQSLAGVDMLSHRLVHLKHFDLKRMLPVESSRSGNSAGDAISQYLAALHQFYPSAKGETRGVVRPDHRVIVSAPLPIHARERMRLFD